MLQEILRELNDAEAYLAGIEKQYETTFLDLPPFKWCALHISQQAPSPTRDCRQCAQSICHLTGRGGRNFPFCTLMWCARLVANA